MRVVRRWLVGGFGFSAFLCALFVSVEAQQPKKIARIGYISGTGNAKIRGLTSKH